MNAALPREALEARIAREREALAEALGDLREQARAGLDLRQRVRERPTAWLGGALLVGFVVGVRS